MGIISYIIVFLLSWWLALFIVLPIGVRTADETGEEVEPGTVPSAPSKPRLLLKMGITTLIALVIVTLFWIADKYNLVTVRDFYS